MEKIILFLLKRRLIVYLFTFLITIAGLGALFSFNIELVPKTNLPQISVRISGGSLPPEEMEEKITKKVEQEIKSMAGVKEYSSTTGTGSVTIRVTAEEGEGERVKQDVQNAVNRLRNNFPKNVDTVNVMQDNLGDEMLIEYAMVGAEPKAMLSLAKTSIKDRIEDVPGVKEVEVSDRSFENKITVTLRPERLAAYHATPSGVIDQLQATNWKQAVGTLENTGFDTVVMIDNSYTTAQELSQLAIDTPKGTVTLDQLAIIDDMRGKVKDFVALTDGQVFVNLSVKRAEGSDLISTQAKVEEVVKQINAEANGQYQLKVMIEAVSYIDHAVTNLSRDVIIGGALAILVLLVFLRNWRVTLVIATTLPLSAMMTFIAMKAGGYNIDMISLLSLSLSVGLIVDAAIVVLESIYQFREKGEPITQAIVKGTREVMTPVFTSQLTIIVVFLPLVLADFESWLKPILGAIAFTVTAAITASTLAAFFFVPVFSDRFLKNDKKVSLEGEGKEHFIVRAFTNLLRKALRHRIKTIMLAVSLFVGSFFLMPFMKMGQGINPNENMVFASITMPTGSTLENTQRAALDAETTLRELPDVKDVFFFASKENAELFLMLKGKKERQYGKDELTLEINERLQAIQGIESITTSFGSQGGAAPVQLDITGEDMEKMRQIAGEVEGMLATIPGVSNIRNDFKEGKEKVTLLPKQEALARMQVDHRSLLQQISMLIGDQPVTTITTDGIEVDVVAKMPEGWLKHPEQLNQIMITSKTGAEVPLGDLVEWRYSKSPVTITHEKGERIVTVSAELLGSDLGTVGRQINEKLPQLAVPAGYQVEIAGKLKEQSSTMTQGLFVFLGVIALIYVIMVAQFGRMSQPFIIMLTIPMALVGVILGFVLTQRVFGEMAMIGMIMLVGIVVSNAILLIDRINLLRERGMELGEAIVQGTKDRVRPVIMTKLTAILGMLPMGLAVAEGSDLEAPLATAVISGLVFHTIVTLVLVPVLYSLFENAKARRLARKQTREAKRLAKRLSKAEIQPTDI
ncbi:efflux RND transporter permease subunit [Brevibacillus borstelensis]|uniref:efflux RND transporter permease subunit n=1 Tax=Brevibacillus borstelensis TaxID=45462 RepID=UPI00046A43C4|nr:efflux RND transporter permease subunit [Brevibacillus borstelensis]MBE5397859.1 efflux RND transporter permease subunit [Brevibacillus borstelensis]MED1745285.1 efflux RND transporter permease subunit [Brevibacillus borstelensis]MED1884568.1 efflux RND transporter permease subunit [Brevibacillus borstelensis]RNB60930.1 efflux RND transporter permease subunit [Brevibacillus borstelensis]GED52671.1 multidrug ABC transporter [Brevibacillus borstelensis]